MRCNALQCYIGLFTSCGSHFIPFPTNAYSYRCKWFFNFGSFCIHFIICDWIGFRDMHTNRERQRVLSTQFDSYEKKNKHKTEKNRANQKIRILMWIPYRMFIVHSMFNSILFSEILSLFATIEHRKLYLHIEMVCLWFQTIVKISCAFSHQILRSSHLLSTPCASKKTIVSFHHLAETIERW